MKFLRNVKTGQIMHWNKQAAKIKEMVLCDAPGKIPAKIEEEPKPEKEFIPETDQGVAMGANSEVTPIPPKPELPPLEEPTDLLSKKEGEALIKKWFDRTVDKVTVKDLYDYAKEKTGEDFPEKMRKLQIVTKLAAELAAREA